MASIQFNLLPDVKMTHVKSQRTHNMVVSIAVVVSAAALALFIVLFFAVNVVQKKLLSDADGDISRLTKELQGVPDIGEIVTAQSQLKSLSTLHQNKHIVSRIFTYLPQVTPANVKVSQVNLDIASNQLSLSGTADSQFSVNKFVDTLKFTKFKVGSGEARDSAFPRVVESSFSISNNNEVTYGLSIEFAPSLFANNLLDSDGKSQTPVLEVPKLTTTHAQSNDPADTLFNSQGGQ